MMTHRRQWYFTVTVCFFMVFLLSVPAAAKKDDNPRRKLGGHHFTPAVTVDYPMLVTNVSSVVGAGYAQMKAGGTTYKLAALLVGINSTIAFTDWIGLRLSLGTGVLSGINSDSALQIGASLNLDFGGGPVFRLFRVGPFQMLAGVDLDFELFNQITPASIAAGVVGTGSALEQTKSLDVSPYVAFALGATKIFGVQASVGYTFAHNFTSSSNDHKVRVGLAASLDLWVVGIQAGYKFGYTKVTGGSQKDHTVEAAIFYTGRGNLSLGFSFQTNFNPDQNDLLIVAGQFMMVYYW